YQYLQEVRQVSGQRADLHGPVSHPQTAEPQHGDRRQVEDEHHDREHRGHVTADEQRDVGEVLVRPCEALALQPLAHERPHHADATDLLAHYLVDAVDALLHEPETRHHTRGDERHGTA